MSVEFFILGPVEARRGGAALEIGHGKQMSVLVVLLIHAGRVVPVDALLDAVWGERPPPTAAKALQVLISKLRRALGPGVIETRSPGYVLRLADAGELDSHRFERLATDGSAALAAGDVPDAAAILRDALSLWRGPALADVAYERFAAPEAARLEELRALALEERVEADLRLGRHATLVAELEERVARAPGRERLWGQLMLALYRCGRQGDALAAYRRARRVLVEDHGIEPGAVLRGLEGAILNQDPALAAPDPPAGPAPSPAVDSDEPMTERRLVSVLFTDLEPGADDPEVHMATRQAAVSAVAEAVAEAGGAIERDAADGVLATFGAAVACEDHAERAVAAATAIHARVGDARVGLESGVALVSGGVTDGPVVTAAARLARRAAPGELVLGPRAAAVAGTAASAAPGAFVGREDELALIDAVHGRVVRDRHPQLVCVLGDAGVGKTSLVRAFQRRRPEAAWHVGRCVAYGRATTFRAVADIVAARLGVAPDAPVEVIRTALAGREILSLAFGHALDAPVDLWQAREQLRAAWGELLAELAAEGPAVVVVEDVHWADDELLELIGVAVRDVAGPLLVVVTGRPELAGRLEDRLGGRNATRLWLEPLTSSEANRMLDALAPGLPGSDRELVLARADGNPFFLEELLRVHREGGPTGRAPPESVQGVVAARMDLLPPAAKAVLQAAAVLGRRFTAGAIHAVTTDGVPLLGLLEDRDFVRREAGHGRAERGYAFKHALIVEAAYATLPARRRARLHAACAAYHEARGAEPTVVAHHYAEAVPPDLAELAWSDEPERRAALTGQAVEWLRRAGALAFSRFELRDAGALYHRAAELATGRERADVLRAAAYAAHHAFELRGFREDMERAIACAADDDQAALLYGELALEGARPYLWQEPPETADVQAWIDAALARAATGSRAQGLALVARASLTPGDSPAVAEQALRIAERVGEPYLLRGALEAAGYAYSARGDVRRALACAERSTAIAVGADPDQQAGQLFIGAFPYLRAARFADVRRFAVRHAEIVARLTPHHRVHDAALAVLLAVLTGGGDAAALAGRAEASADANRDAPCQFNWRTLAMAALLLARDGDGDAAARLERLGREAAPRPSSIPVEPAFLRLALLRDDRVEVEALVAADPGPNLFDVDYGAARLDALAYLGDRAGVESAASVALRAGGYAEPFALRALARVRADRALAEKARRRFVALGIGTPEGPH